MPKEFEVVFDSGGEWTPISRIRKSRIKIIRKKDKKILGESITISHGPNWIFRASTGGTDFCPKLGISTQNISKAIFKQQSN
jgi:hypothetical protein